VPDATSAAPNDAADGASPAAAPANTPRRRATTIVLQAGAVAGALASIVGIALLAFHGVSSLFGGEAPVDPVSTLRLTIQRPSVHLETYGLWAKRNVAPEHPAAARAIEHSASANVRGIEVDYDISAPNVAVGTVYRLRYTLLREPGQIPVGPPIDDLKRFKHRGDVCGCASAFIALPRTSSLYRVEVTIAPASSHDDNPAHRVVSETFRGAASIS
jgi:hypothetical protein